MNVLITGGAGFIGTNLIARLQELDAHQIAVLDDFSLGRKEHLAGRDVEVFEGKVQDAGVVGRALKGRDAVIHLAAATRALDSIKDPAAAFEANVIGTFNVMETARRLGVQTVVFASSGGTVLGQTDVLPVREDLPARPISPYGASKLFGEGLCSAYAGSYGMRAMALRFSNVYGPVSAHKQSVIAHFLKSIIAEEPITVFGDGSQIRDYLYVDDLCDGIRRALDRGRAGACYQFGSGTATNLNDLIQAIRKTVGPDNAVDIRHAEARRGEVKDTYPDIGLARRELGFAPTTDLAAGLRRTWDWMKQPAQ